MIAEMLIDEVLRSETARAEHLGGLLLKMKVVGYQIKFDNPFHARVEIPSVYLPRIRQIVADLKSREIESAYIGRRASGLPTFAIDVEFKSARLA